MKLMEDSDMKMSEDWQRFKVSDEVEKKGSREWEREKKERERMRERERLE